jgi:hypothetical protein
MLTTDELLDETKAILDAAIAPFSMKKFTKER